MLRACVCAAVACVDKHHQEVYHYSRFPIIQILRYPNAWTSLVTGVLLQEKAKLLYEQLFPNATTSFSASTILNSSQQKVLKMEEAIVVVLFCFKASLLSIDRLN